MEIGYKSQNGDEAVCPPHFNVLLNNTHNRMMNTGDRLVIKLQDCTGGEQI